MAEQKARHPVPKLRFPEFWEAGEWLEAPLVELAKFRRGSFPQPYGLPEWYDEANGMPFIQVFDVSDDLRLKPKTKNNISKLGAEQSVFIAKGTLIITLQGSIGRVAITQYDAYIDRTLLIFEEFFQPTEKLFFAYIIQSLFEIEKEKAPGGIIKTITKEALSSFIVKLPNFGEQQKIAACLSSLDELITAQTQKVEALKTHKKGLMQQLFPATGETVPKLRFPEFRDAGEWSVKQLKQVCAVNPVTPELPEIFAYIDLESVEAGELKAKKIISREESPSRAQRLLNYGDVIFQIVRPYQRNNFYFRIHDDIKYVASTGYAQLRAFESKDFLFQVIHTDDFVEKVIAKCTGSSYPAINSSDLTGIAVAIPKLAEQQKIADCLSSIDELITAQTQTLAALKAHKKGLMQQLFPAANETQ